MSTCEFNGDFNDDFEFGNFESQVQVRDVANALVAAGLTAQYVSDCTYESALESLDKGTFLVYTYGTGDQIIMLSDNEIDLVRLTFETGRGLRD